MSNFVRLDPEERKAMIISAAVKTANAVGLFGWTRASIANACLVATSSETVKHYFPRNIELRKLIAAHPDANETVKADAKSAGMSIDAA